MKVNELKPGVAFAVKGDEWQYWRYTGKFEGYFVCHFCHKVRKITHEFLHYLTMEDLEHNPEGFDLNYHFGTECIKLFIGDLTIKEVIIE